VVRDFVTHTISVASSLRPSRSCRQAPWLSTS
jgi:hypothetical protein